MTGPAARRVFYCLLHGRAWSCTVRGRPRGAALAHGRRGGAVMDQIWFTSALWIGLALVASIASIYVTISVALVEIIVGAIAGNMIGLPLTPWVNYLASFGAILLTFLAGTEVDMDVVRRNMGASLGIGFISFLAPYLGCLAAARYLLGWSWPEAQIAGIALSTTSVAVVYAVMVET